MISLQQIEQDLTAAIKAKEKVAVDVLRGLKTRIANEKIAKGKDLSEEEIVVLIRSESKKRKEAAAVYMQGGRPELAEKETQEVSILEKYLPKQLSEEELGPIISSVIAENGFTQKDFGKAMGVLKAKVGSTVDGATLAKLLKELLK